MLFGKRNLNKSIQKFTFPNKFQMDGETTKIIIVIISMKPQTSYVHKF